MLHAVGEFGVVAVDDVEGFLVGGEEDGVGAVFAAALDAAELVGLVELVVAVGVAEAPESLAAGLFVDHDVEAVEGVEEAVGAADFGREFFDFGGGGGADRGGGHPVEAAVLVAGEDSAFGVDGHADPRAFVGFGDDVEEFGAEAGEESEFVGADDDRGGGAGAEGVAPGGGAVFAGDGGFLPGAFAGELGLPGVVGFEDDVGAVLGFDAEAGDEGGDAALVLGFGADFVAAGFEAGGDVGLGGGIPVVVGEDEFAVEEDLGAVVAGDLELGFADFEAEVEFLAEADGGGVGLGVPDPGPFGPGEAGGGEGGTQDEGAQAAEGGEGVHAIDAR
jgi:hypothetical protein